MNLSPLWVPFLQQHGFEADHWSSLGSPSAPDAEIMDHARAGGFVIFTHDLDFGMLLALQGSVAPSVVQIRTQYVLPTAAGALVVNALNAARAHLESGALVTIDPVQHRIRLLPMRRD
jgi:predicted nuclease of predicted toxin-antitoxin system